MREQQQALTDAQAAASIDWRVSSSEQRLPLQQHWVHSCAHFSTSLLQGDVHAAIAIWSCGN